jgi:hypothetical protein
MTDRFNLRRAGAAAGMLALALVPVVAEAGGVRATIPFSFLVNGATLPPGSYLLSSSVPTPGTIVVRGATRVVITMTSPRGTSEDFQPRLVFHRYGEEYFLRQVWTDGGTGHDVRETAEERDRREGRSGRAQVAPERVVVPGL